MGFMEEELDDELSDLKAAMDGMEDFGVKAIEEDQRKEEEKKSSKAASSK